MLKRLQNTIAVVLFVILVSGYGYAICVSSEYPSSQQHRSHKTEKTASSKDKQNPWGEPIVIVTWFLVIVGCAQFALFWVQLRFIRIGMADTKEAANAAKASADALPLLERAYVFIKNVESPDIRDSLTLGDTTEGRFTLMYCFQNHGRTPAIIQDINVMARYLEFPPWEAERGRPFPAPLVIGRDEVSQVYEFNFPVLGNEYEKAKVGNGSIFFWGKLGYLDIFEVRHEVVFCAEWHFGESRFVVSAHKDRKLNYYT